MGTGEKSPPQPAAAAFVVDLAVRFHEVDPAGIVFFARIFQYAHDAYEVWIRSVGFPLDVPIETRGYGLPLVHAEADFQRPIRLAQERIRIEIRPVAVGKSSYTMSARLLSPAGECHAVVTTVHACIDPASGRARPLPEDLRAAVSAQLSGSLPSSGSPPAR